MAKLSKAQRAQAEIIRAELTKVRCWVSGFRAGRSHALRDSVPGEDGLRQAIMFIDEITAGEK